MKVFIDSKLIEKISSPKPLLEAGIQSGLLKEGESIEFLFGWAALLDYLELGTFLETLPKFELSELYKVMISALDKESTKDAMIHLYEQLFAEILTQVNALLEIQPAFLLDRMQAKKQEVFAPSLSYYENILKEDPKNALHDLTLYIAWDRVCVDIAMIFEQSSSNIRIRNHLETLKECLVDSFLHIMEQGKTLPSFFRLMEAFYAYDMREDNLQLHTDAEWLILCQGARALKSRETLPDVFYVDAAIALDANYLLKGFTLDSVEKIQSGQALAKDAIRKIKQAFPKWQYTFCPVTTISVQECEKGICFNALVQAH